MIIDKFENISKYNIISQKVIDFLNTLTVESETGHYEIDENSYANIDVYETKSYENCKFEAHKKYIDIQMLLLGVEELDFMSVEGLSVSDEYDSKRDIMFFQNPDKLADRVILQSGKFAIIYPHEAHKPQMNINGLSHTVKKVVVKILV